MASIKKKMESGVRSRNSAWLLLASAFCLLPLSASTKTEDALRAQLAQAQAQIAQAAKDHAAMVAALAKVNADNTTKAVADIAASQGATAATKAATAATAQRATAEVTAGANAVQAQTTADTNAAAAKAQVESLQAQIVALQNNSDHARVLQEIAAVGGFIVLFIPVLMAVVKVWGAAGDRKAEHQAVMDQIALAQAQVKASTKSVEDTKTAVTSLEVEHASSAKVQEAKLDMIHSLVNSNMTAAMEGQLDALQSSLVSLLEIVGMRTAAGALPNPDSASQIATLKAKIAELKAQVLDRLHATAFPAPAK